MVVRRSSFSQLTPAYLFAEIARRKKQFLVDNPTAELISLGIGDTVLPLPETVTAALKARAAAMGTAAGYTGYGDEQGSATLRCKIAESVYSGAIDPSEIFISDGAKCDLGRLQLLFGPDVAIAVQDPSYPVYVDGSLLQGVRRIDRLPCLPNQQFFPAVTTLPSELDLIYLCNPNNPMGVAYTQQQLEQLIEIAEERAALIILDAAYADYIRDPRLPQTLFSLKKGKNVAIEVRSFSKMAGFSGLRLGWTVVPKALTFADGRSVWEAWHRLYTTLFNGASVLIQDGALALFQQEGAEQCDQRVAYYIANAQLLKAKLQDLGYRVYGGDHAPYLWVEVAGYSSWEAFDFFLHTKHLIVTPGVGYGASGEGFIRISSFGHRAQIEAACHRLESAAFNSASSFL
ncbi:MAG: LL-diaminopimelate aminotransferase [Chlamydiota bacterium]